MKHRFYTPKYMPSLQLCRVCGASAGTGDECLIARHPDPEINALYRARRKRLCTRQSPLARPVMPTGLSHSQRLKLGTWPARSSPAVPIDPRQPRTHARPHRTTGGTMSDKQRSFMLTLINERDITSLSEVQQAYLGRIIAGEVDPAGGRGGPASRIIDALLALPRKPEQGAADVPAGRYAVALGGRNAIEFFKVDRPTEGKWNGYTFVKQQASDDEYPVKGARKAEVLAAIAVDPQAALLRYGQEIGTCGRCGITLTDDVSREMGIGPDCAQQLGISRPAPAPRQRARAKATKTEKALHEQRRGPVETADSYSQITGELPGESWEDIFKGQGA